MGRAGVLVPTTGPHVRRPDLPHRESGQSGESVGHVQGGNRRGRGFVRDSGGRGSGREVCLRVPESWAPSTPSDLPIVRLWVCPREGGGGVFSWTTPVVGPRVSRRRRPSSDYCPFRSRIYLTFESLARVDSVRLGVEGRLSVLSVNLVRLGRPSSVVGSGRDARTVHRPRSLGHLVLPTGLHRRLLRSSSPVLGGCGGRQDPL